MSQQIEKNVPPGEPVFGLQGVQESYQTHEMIVSWQSSFGDRLKTAVLTPISSELQPIWHLKYEFPEKAVRKLRLLQQGSSQVANWSITELRVLRRGLELHRAPQWSSRTSHNRWELPSAFDNNPVTRWNSGQPLKPGMWLELDFGKEERIDSVVVDCGADQSETRMRLEFESAPGRWAGLDGEAAVERSEIPPGLRSAAIATLKLNRVYWLLVNDHDGLADDINPHPEAWGVRRVATDGEWMLYSLNGSN